MRHKGNTVPGELPGYGAIFMSNTGTKKECFQRKLLGLPLAQSNFVLHVKKGMILFLFEFERRQLHGVFRATSNGEMDIEPNAYKSSGKHFPAQVRFTHVWNCKSLAEHEFKDAIRDNYFSGKKFRFGLSKDQVYKLITLFHSKKIPKTHPERSIWQHDDDKASEGNARFGDNRKNIRDRIRFVKQEDGQRFGTDEVKVDDQGFRTHKDNRDRVLTKRLDHSLGGLKSANLHCMHDVSNENEMHNHPRESNGHFGKITVASNDDIANKNTYFRDDDNRTQRDYYPVNSFSQSLSSHNLGNSIPDRGSQMIDEGGYFGHSTLTEQSLCKPNDVWISPNYEPRRSTEHPPYEPRLTDLSLSHFNQNDSDFIPISEVPDQFQLPFEFNNLGNTYDYLFPNSTSCDPSSVITMHTPYDPEVPEFCHKSSYFSPGPCSSPTDNLPIPMTETVPYHSQKKHSDAGKFRSSYVRKVSVFDRLTSAPKTVKVNHEQRLESDEKDELDASVNKVMKMLEKIVSSPIKRAGKRQSTFKQDDDDYNNNNNKIVDYKVQSLESEGIEGGESVVVEETRVVDFKRRKKTNKNLDLDDESKSDLRKRRKLVRPVFLKKESDENTPLKVDSHLTKTVKSVKNMEGQKSSIACSQVKENENASLKVESLKNIEGQKSSIACFQVEENEKAENCEKLEEKLQEKAAVAVAVAGDDMNQVETSTEGNSKMCGWVE